MGLEPESAGRAVAWLRIALESLFLVFVLVAMPLVALFVTRSELFGIGLVAGAMALWVAYDLVTNVRSHRRSVAKADGRDVSPRRDAIWDHVRDTESALGLGQGPEILALSLPIHGPELLDGLVRRTWAIPMGNQRPDAVKALELAMAATGVANPPEVYWAPGSGANAAVAGTAHQSIIVLGEELLATFNADALLGVLANLLVRLDDGTVSGIPSWDPPGILGNAKRITPEKAVRVYEAADAQTVLALRDATPLFSALRASAVADPFLPGLTADQAHLLWTWPSAYAPLVASTDAEQAGLLLAMVTGGPSQRRLELSRMERLVDVLGSEAGTGSS